MPKPEPQYIIPFAKPSGMTSFTSLWQVKYALGTKKIGHTGTLDCFADGLLVLLSGKLTKLVPYIMDFDKTYRVLFYFGKETDTLDPEGVVIDEKPLPTYADFISAVRQLTGTIKQVPPVYSAVKQAGKRLSDRIRRGESVTVPPRTVTVYSRDMEEVFYVSGSGVDGLEKTADKRVAGAVLCVHCSKGTYIRSLVRDIARRCGSAAYVYALRRTAVGPFTLEQAAGADALSPFGNSPVKELSILETGNTASVQAFKPLGNAVSSDAALNDTVSVTEAAIKRAALPLSEDIARAMNFQTAVLQEKYYPAFMNGRPISEHWFTVAQPLLDGGTIAVFYNGGCAGLVIKNGTNFSYQTVFLCA